MYNFDEIICRENTDSVKWSQLEYNQRFDQTGAMLPFWIADMDFKSSPAIVEAVIKRAEHGIYGYSNSLEHQRAFIDWVSRRFHWQIKPEWILYTPGVVTAINLAIKAFCLPEDQVLIQEPVYYPFAKAIKNNRCHVISNDLVWNENQYTIDFEDFEQQVKDPKTTLFILCSPHNPVARLWTVDELQKMIDLCIENDVFVIADEIHNDLAMPGYKHHILANIAEKNKEHVMTCMSPSKTFNLAGMQLSSIIIANPKHRERFRQVLESCAVGEPNPFAIPAVVAAYDNSEEWVDELLVYIQQNVNFVQEYLGEKLPKVRFVEHQATYLMWLDFRELGLSQAELEHKIFTEAKVALDGGTWFGDGGIGFMRINVACPKAILKEGLDKIIQVLK